MYIFNICFTFLSILYYFMLICITINNTIVNNTDNTVLVNNTNKTNTKQ